MRVLVDMYASVVLMKFYTCIRVYGPGWWYVPLGHSLYVQNIMNEMWWGQDACTMGKSNGDKVLFERTNPSQRTTPISCTLHSPMTLHSYGRQDACMKDKSDGDKMLLQRTNPACTEDQSLWGHNVYMHRGSMYWNTRYTYGDMMHEKRVCPMGRYTFKWWQNHRCRI